MTDVVPHISVSNVLRSAFRAFLKRPTFFAATSISGPLLSAAYPFVFWLYRTNGGTHREPVLSWLPTIVGTVVATTLMLLGTVLSSVTVCREVAAMEEADGGYLSARHSPQKVRIWSVIGIVCSIFLRLFLAALLVTLMAMVVLAAAAALGFNTARVAGAIGFAVAAGWLIGVILSSIRIYARYALALPSCVVEAIGRRAALKRSVYLTARHRGLIVALYSAFMTLSCAIAAGELSLLTHSHGIAIWTAEALGALLAGALIAPFWTLTLSIIYCRERDLADGEATRSPERVASALI